MAKFKVNDWVFLIIPLGGTGLAPMIHILEVGTQLCEANIEQVMYVGRVCTKTKNGSYGYSKQMIFREMELQTYEEAETQLKKANDGSQ